MTRTRKAIFLLCALLLAAQLTLGATAVGPVYTLTLNNTGATEHTFEVYQIFTGDLSVNAGGDKVLSNIVWGDGVTTVGQSALGNAREKAETLLTEADARAFANQLAGSGYLTNATTKTVASGASDTVANLEPGYYLVRDQAATQSGESSAYTAYILEVVGDVTATPKIDIPSVQKSVQDINDTLDNTIADNAWQDSADHDIGDVIPYQIVGTLPTNYADYTTYTYAFSDTMSSGLTYQADARVFVDNGGVETEITSQAVISPTTTMQGATLAVSMADLKSLTGVTIDPSSRIIVRYSAILNNDAVHGGAGNPNTVTLTYSNDPNPGGTGTGVTPQDKVTVFTYRLVVDKVDEANDPLPNAGFTLYKKDSAGVWQTIKTYAGGADTSFTFSGLDDGEYKLEESTVPTGYNKMEDLIFTISAEHDASSANPQLTSLNGATADGQIITLAGTQQASVSLSTGTISATIVNKTGAVLPTTGGIGTTIFYVVGGLFAVFAAVMLITKRRMKAEE